MYILNKQQVARNNIKGKNVTDGQTNEFGKFKVANKCLFVSLDGRTEGWQT